MAKTKIVKTNANRCTSKTKVEETGLDSGKNLKRKGFCHFLIFCLFILQSIENKSNL